MKTEQYSAQRTLHAALFGALLVSGSLGCGEELDQDPRPPERVQVVFDPDTATIPLPNAAAVEQDGTLPRSEAERGTAQAAFYGWINDLHGWLPEQPIEVPFDGKLKAESIGVEDVLLMQIAEDESVTLLDVAEVIYDDTAEEGSPAQSRIIIRPAAPLKGSSRYGVVVKTSIEGENGQPVIAPLGIFFALNDGPLVDENDRVTIPQLESQPDTARSIEALVRQNISPITDNLSTLGIEDRKNIAAAFTWETSTDVFSILDPATATIPLPNTLALDAEEDGPPTFPAAALDALSEYRRALDAGESPARNSQIYFEEYLDKLHGWPNTVSSLPIEVPLTGPIDEATLTEESVQLWVVDPDDGPMRMDEVTREYVEEQDADGNVVAYKIALRPAEDFALNTDYFAFATKELKDEQGKELLPPAAMLLGMQPEPLIDEEGNPTVAELDAPSAQAAAGVQATLRPFMEYIEDNAGYEFDDLVSVWSWYTWRDPFIVFDPLSEDVPFPNAFLVGEDGLVSIPPMANSNPLSDSLFGEVNTRDGFSQMAAGWITVFGELDPASLTLFQGTGANNNAGSIAMASVPGVLPEVVDEDVVDFEFVSDYGKIMMRPQLPLEQGTRHVVVLSDRIKGTNGLSAQPTPIFVMLASEYPLYEEGQGSLVAQLPDAAAPDLEEARLQYRELFLGAEIATGDTRDTIAGAFVFTTDDHTTPLQRARARTLAKLGERDALLFERACDVDDSRDCDADLIDNTDGLLDAYNGAYADGLERDFSHIAQIQWAGEFSTVNMLVNNGNDFANWDDIDETMRVGVSVFVPKTVPGQCEPPFRIAITQHGLTSTRLVSGLGFANEFAAPQNCLAVVAPDAHLHGGRSNGGDSLHPTASPNGSGDGYLSANFVQSKHHFMQGTIDLVVLNQLIRDGALEALVENTTGGAGPMFDTERVGVTGTSLGGILVTALGAIDPDIDVVNLAVAPGKLTYYLTEPSSIGDDLLAPLALLGIERGTFAFEQLITFLQWVGDEVDPAIFASHLTEDTLEVLEYDPADDSYDVDGEVEEAQVFVQMARNDELAPNVSTEQLAEIVGVSLEDSTFDAPHPFIGRINPADDSFAASECARRQAAFFLRAAIDGEDTDIPEALKADTCVSTFE